MKPKRIKFLLFIPFFLLLAVTSSADDTDLYMASGQGVEANVLIIFDNSGSMNDEIRVFFYDPSTTYDPLVVPQAYRDRVYYRVFGGGWKLFANSISNVACPVARTALTNNGHYEGNTNSTCTSTSRTLRTGNYRNYLASIGGSEYQTKLSIAKNVINDFLDTINGVRIGVMVFNKAKTVDGISDSEGGRLQSSIKSLNDTNRSQLKNDINNIVAETWTPLAETLYEAGLYFKGGPSYFNDGVVYTSPIQFYCQRNYVILITDGDSTRDRNPILARKVGDQDGDGREPGGANEVRYIVDGQDMLGTDYLDDVAQFLYNGDLRADLTGQQNIITYTIGFTVHSQHSLLERTAEKGHGRYFFSDNAQQLADAFQNIVSEILEKSSSFVAPLVPVSRMERTSAGDKIYLALFQPKMDRMWSGNIKKFGVAQENNAVLGISIGDIVDADGKAALDQHGEILPTARSFWTTIPMDGGDVEKGGVGEILRNRSSDRNIYTYLEVNADLTHSSNSFNRENISPTMLGLLSDDHAERDKLIQFVHGYDAYDDNGNGVTDEKRDWILGSFLHSRPLLIHYESRSVIFAGANDGMLHAFDDSDGSELWAFIPPNLLTKLQALQADVVESFVDGSPRAYISYGSGGQISRAILIFGERRGGNHYYALDVTDPLSPRYLWKISPDLPGFAELGQTWSSPIIGKIASSTGDKWVAFIGGGYDENQDNDPLVLPDAKGRAIYVVDVLDGSLVWRYSFQENNQMAFSIPSDIQRVDTNGDGRIDRLYVGDMGGQIWRFDISDPDPAQWTGKIIFKSNVGGGKRKIFYPPDVTLEKDTGNYEMLFFGTGDREHPKESTTINRLYAVKDKNPSTPLTEDHLVDVTQDPLQDVSTSEADKASILSALSTRDGWFIRLEENPGEKCLSNPVVYYGVVYYTTFAPTFGTEGDPCFVGEGTARLYALRYKSGNAVFNLDDSLDGALSRSDRSKIIGTGIPSGVIITFVKGVAVAYAGVGGPGGPRVPKPRLRSGKSIVPVTWRIVF
ncbi:MAG: pilus assembly protein [Thermodesulfobacteriota bacterium]